MKFFQSVPFLSLRKIYFDAPEAESVQPPTQEVETSLASTLPKDTEQAVYALEDAISEKSKSLQETRQSLIGQDDIDVNFQLNGKAVNNEFGVKIESSGSEISIQEKTRENNGEKYKIIQLKEDFSDVAGEKIKERYSVIRENADGTKSVIQHVILKDIYGGNTYSGVSDTPESDFTWNTKNKSELEDLGLDTTESGKTQMANILNRIANKTESITKDIKKENIDYANAKNKVIEDIAREQENQEAEKILSEFPEEK